MRLLKAQNTNLRNIYGKGVKYDYDDQVIVDSERALLVPKGDTDSRPGAAGIATAAVNGQLRYNIDDEQLEAYQNGAWREIRFKEPNRDPGIVIQTFSGADDTETVFGELNSGDSDYPYPLESQNIMVYVENVYQLPGTNYNIRQTAEVDATGPSSPYTEIDTGWWIEFTSPVPTGKEVTVVHNFDK